jgi:hypothetical protein
VTDERARTNVVYPSLAVSKLRNTHAFEVFDAQFLRHQRKGRREDVGDNLHKPASILVAAEHVVGAFGAIFQGDHLGVEVETDAHARMLQSWGLLQEESRLQSSKPVFEDDCVSGLVVDDFFVVSKESINDSNAYDESLSVAQFKVAKEAYQAEGLLGSDAKDVVGQTTFTVCGGEVCSGAETVRRGAVTLGAPFQKRMSLAMFTVSAASLPSTSDAVWSCLVGSWISALLLRRPAMSILDEAFKVIPSIHSYGSYLE